MGVFTVNIFRTFSRAPNLYRNL